MCGIFGYIGQTFDINELYQCLLMLQNRGYDSAGMSAIINNDFLVRKFATIETKTAFDILRQHLNEFINLNNFISHARYSCVGIPSDYNSHPHVDFTNKFSLVHNGIIENYSQLKSELIEEGVKFKSDTDTEVIVNLIGYYHALNHTVKDSIDMAIKRLTGTWALAIQSIDEPDKLYCARYGSPLLIGFGQNFIMVASEQSSFRQHVKNYISLNNHDIIELNNHATIDLNNYKLLGINQENFESTPAPYDHWTIKEIHEQFDSSIRTMTNRIIDNKIVKLGGLESFSNELIKLDNLILLGCGTSYHAGLYASYLFKQISGFNTVQVFDGAEFDKTDIPKTGKTGLVLLSQSGETKDLYRCIDIAKENNLITIGVINVVNSAIAREVHCGVYLNAGKEMGVASTKCFTSQVIALSMIACWFSQNRSINEAIRISILRDLRRLPYDIQNVINMSEQCLEISRYLFNRNDIFLLGKGKNMSISMEGALKIKEIGYINANGYSTASLKHGSYALLDKGFPVIILLPNDNMFHRNHSVGEELKSRRAFVISISDTQVDRYDHNLRVPKNETFFGLIANVCLQLIAYHTAVLRGNSVDCPKNLAKCVTVD